MDVFAHLICRPPRKEYRIEELGPVHFRLGDWICSRRDLEIVNKIGLKLACSHYVPRRTSGSNIAPCVIYLHGNSGSRVDADDFVESFLEKGMSVFSMDLSGCGKSDGDYVTLGLRERHDLEAVLDHLEADVNVLCCGVFGRSMGAAIAVMVASDEEYQQRIKCLVLDSVYTSVAQVVHEMAGKYVGKIPLVPWQGMVGPAVEMLRQSVKAKAGYDFSELDVLSAARQCRVPVLIGHASGDELVFPSHSHQLFDVYGEDTTTTNAGVAGGQKELCIFDGDHNSLRPTDFNEKILGFFTGRFEEEARGVCTRSTSSSAVQGVDLNISGWFFGSRDTGRIDREDSTSAGKENVIPNKDIVTLGRCPTLRGEAAGCHVRRLSLDPPSSIDGLRAPPPLSSEKHVPAIVSGKPGGLLYEDTTNKSPTEAAASSPSNTGALQGCASVGGLAEGDVVQQVVGALLFIGTCFVSPFLMTGAFGAPEA